MPNEPKDNAKRVFDNLHACILETDSALRIVYASNFRRTFGEPFLPNRNLFEIVHFVNGDKDRANKILLAKLTGDAAIPPENHYRFERFGEIAHAIINTSTIYLDGKVIGLRMEVTEVNSLIRTIHIPVTNPDETLHFDTLIFGKPIVLERRELPRDGFPAANKNFYYMSEDEKRAIKDWFAKSGLSTKEKIAIAEKRLSFRHSFTQKIRADLLEINPQYYSRLKQRLGREST